MWNLIENMPQASLDSWYRWLTYFAIGLPILGAAMGGVSGWAAFIVNSRISDLQAVALKQQLAEADKKVAELDRVRQPRHLTEEQKTKLAKFITGNFSGNASFTIKAQASESDARAYADEIAKIFNAPPIHWQVTVDNAMIMGPDTSGIWISIKDGRAPPLATGLLHAALTDAGLPIKKDVEVDPGIPSPDEIWLTVGNKK